MRASSLECHLWPRRRQRPRNSDVKHDSGMGVETPIRTKDADDEGGNVELPLKRDIYRNHQPGRGRRHIAICRVVRHLYKRLAAGGGNGFIKTASSAKTTKSGRRLTSVKSTAQCGHRPCRSVIAGAFLCCASIRAARWKANTVGRIEDHFISGGQRRLPGRYTSTENGDSGKFTNAPNYSDLLGQ